MSLSTGQAVIMIGAVVLGTLTPRFLPFLIFPDNRPTPKYIQYLGKVLPFAVIGLLVVYCVKSVPVLTWPYGLPEGIAVLGIVLLHWWKRNMLLSIGGGTILYMLLVQLVFV